MLSYWIFTDLYQDSDDRLLGNLADNRWYLVGDSFDLSAAVSERKMEIYGNQELGLDRVVFHPVLCYNYLLFD